MATSEINVRPYREDDLSEWFRLRSLLWDESSEEDQKEEMMDILVHGDDQFVAVAEAEPGVLVGFLEASIRPYVEDCAGDHVGYLEGWFVAPDFRKQKIGKRLVQVAEKWAKGHGCTEMASDAELYNETSIAAHKSLGYSESSRLVHFKKEL